MTYELQQNYQTQGTSHVRAMSQRIEIGTLQKEVY